MLDLGREKFDKVLEHFQEELAKLRSGRANAGMIADVKVDYYGTPMALNQLGTISIPEPRQLLIQPWDKNALAPIEKAVGDAALGLNPVNEGDKIRISLPELTEERRKELAKIVGKIAEEARVKIRAIREEIWKAVQAQEKSGEIPEDEKFRQQKKLQEVVDEYNQKIKELTEKKEREIMTI